MKDALTCGCSICLRDVDAVGSQPNQHAAAICSPAVAGNRAPNPDGQNDVAMQGRAVAVERRLDGDPPSSRGLGTRLSCQAAP